MSSAGERSPGRSQYRFLRRIATGGMAELYLGEASGVGGVTKRVALKRMLPSHAQDREFLTMFLEEARLASTLQHPNIVQTYDVIQSGDEYLIVMEFLEGSDLQQFRRRMNVEGVSLTLEHILYIMRAVLQGLHFAHDSVRPDGRSLGVVHRDVSPQNIFLTFSGGVKLLDFGIAKSTASLNRTESGILKGKVLYMSPEQCSGGDVDRRSDLYSVGVVMYQLLTGTVPHRGKNAYDTMRSIIETPPPRPSHINPRIHADLERIVMKAMRRRAQERYATAWDMLTDIEAFAQDKGLFASTVGFSTLVEKVLGPRKPPSETTTLVLGQREPLPPDIDLASPLHHVPDSTTEAGEAPAPSPVMEQTLADGEHYTLKRIHGVQLLTLRGVLDERFDPDALDGLLKGEVVIDSGEVSRITSFGIRSLITLLNKARPRVAGLYHVRCSVPLINQVTMIRGLLGGGRVLSFHAPYVDSVTGAYFTAVLSGREARRAVDDHVLPTVPSPSDESVPAEFDDDPHLYLNFAQDFQEDVPNHLAPVLQAIEDQSRRLDVELTLEDAGPVLTVRRPIRSDARWSRVLGGLEGNIRLDLTDVPAATEDGIDAFVTGLEAVSGQLQSVQLVGVPVVVCEGIAASPTLRPMMRLESLQVEARCRTCKTERRANVPVSRIRGTDGGPVSIAGACGRCGGALEVITSFQGLDAFGLATMSGLVKRPAAQDRPAPATSRGCLRNLVTAALLLTVGASALLVLVR